MLSFYNSTVRSSVEYACPVWHTGLTGEQSDSIEAIQKRAMRIIYPELSYAEALALAGLDLLHSRRERIASSLFSKMLSPDHKLHHLIPEPRNIEYGLRRAKKYPLPILRTQRARRLTINH